MSANDGAGIDDAATAELNRTDEPDHGLQAAPIPDRPADGSGKDAWVDYVVALGGDRMFITEDTKHFDGVDYAVEPGLTRTELIALADRLGG